jgi:hypothetical protein
VSTCGDILRASEGSENKNDKLFVPKGEKAWDWAAVLFSTFVRNEKELETTNRDIFSEKRKVCRL